MSSFADRIPALTQLWQAAAQPSVRTPGAAAQGRLLSAAELLRPALLLLVATVLVVGSALMVIYSAYEYRRLFNQHQILVQQGDELQVEWGQFLLEQSAWGANNRVEVLAAERLEMVAPEAKMIEILRHEQ